MARSKFYDDEDFEQRDRKRIRDSVKEQRKMKRQRKVQGQTEWQNDE